MDKDWLLPSPVYDVLKWVGLVCLPSLGVFISVIGPVWGLPYVDAIVTTINALGVLIGALIGASQLSVMGGN